MTDRERTLLAIAGIAATALVGLAGTAAAWLTAREDRATQRALAREASSYDRRVSAYLDAVGFVQQQKRPFDRFLGENEDPGETWDQRSTIPLRTEPPNSLVTRLHVFGSRSVRDAFGRVEDAFLGLGLKASSLGFRTRAGHTQIFVRVTGATAANDRFRSAYDNYRAQVSHFEDEVEAEVGG